MFFRDLSGQLKPAANVGSGLQGIWTKLLIKTIESQANAWD